MTTNEHKLARAMIAAHVDNPEVAEIVLDTVDAWADVVQRASEALEQQQRSADDLNRFYTVAELRVLLKKSDSGVRAMLDAGVFPQTHVGASVRVPIVDVERYLAERTNCPEATPRTTRQPRYSPDEQALLKRWPGLAS